MHIAPFTIRVPDKVLADLRTRIRNTRWPDQAPGARVQAPVGFANFDSNYVSEGKPPREWVERLYDVRRWTSMPSGGHFAAAEKPELLARDIAAFFAEI